MTNSISYNSNFTGFINHVAYGMLMPDRNSASDYRFGFNGMEQDDELKGDGNSYDFGARIYDSRLGRFLSRDKFATILAHQSPYISSNNNPVRFIDINGNVAGEPEVIRQGLIPSGNVIIVLRDVKDEYLKEKMQDNNWDIIVVEDLADGANWIAENYSKNSLQNVYIVTHGAGISGEPYNGLLLGTGGIIQGGSDNDDNGEKDYYFNKQVILNHAAYERYKEDCKNPESPPSSYTQTQIDALEKIGDHLKSDANVCFTACRVGADDRMGYDLGEIMLANADDNKKINIYLNVDQSFPRTGKKDSKRRKIDFDKELNRIGNESGQERNYGWVKSAMSKKQYFKEERGFNLMVKRNGGFKHVNGFHLRFNREKLNAENNNGSCRSVRTLD